MNKSLAEKINAFCKSRPVIKLLFGKTLGLTLCIFMLISCSAAGTANLTSGNTGATETDGNNGDGNNISTDDLVLETFEGNPVTPVTYSESNSFRFIISQDIVNGGGYRETRNSKFYMNNNGYNVIVTTDE